MELPIDIVSGTTPPLFHWKQTVNTINGAYIINHEGMMLPSVEKAIVELVEMVKQIATERDDLIVELKKSRGMNEELAKRIAEQSELLSKRAEKPEQAQTLPLKAKKS